MKNVLMIAFHFPPQAGSSGILRTIKFCRYLPEFGWKPTVLTVHPRVYDKTDYGQLQDIPPDVQVLRSFAFNTKRHLSICGHYLRFLSLPDQWVSWIIGGVTTAIKYMRKNHIDIIYSTYPIATALVIGWILHLVTQKPWIVDFRDSMTEREYPINLTVRKTYQFIERQVVKNAAALIFTAKSSRKMYLDRYTYLDPDSCFVIPNGYDRADLCFIPSEANIIKSQKQDMIRLVHNGLIYPDERDPRPFFRAIARLKKEGIIGSTKLQIDLRASGFEDVYQGYLQSQNIQDIVQLQPHISYKMSLRESMAADAMLLFQAENCNHQIPAKVYEYFAIGKPILALTSKTGDTAELLRNIGGSTIMDIANENEIVDNFPAFLEFIRTGTHPLPDKNKTAEFSRRNQSQIMASLLDKIYTSQPGQHSIT